MKMYMTKLTRSFETLLGHDLNMCILFAYNSQIILSLFYKLHLVIIQALFYIQSKQIVGTWCETPPTASFMPIFRKLYRCFGHGLKMCIRLDIILRLVLLLFFHKLSVVAF